MGGGHKNRALAHGDSIPLLSKLADAPSGPRGTALSHREFDIETKNTFPLAPLGERGDRKARGEGVPSKIDECTRSDSDSALRF